MISVYEVIKQNRKSFSRQQKTDDANFGSENKHNIYATLKRKKIMSLDGSTNFKTFHLKQNKATKTSNSICDYLISHLLLTTVHHKKNIS